MAITKGKYMLNKELGEKQEYQCGKTGINKKAGELTEADLKRMMDAGNTNVTEKKAPKP